MSPIMVDEDIAPQPPAVIASLAVNLSSCMCLKVSGTSGALSPTAAVAAEYWDDDGPSGDEVVLLAHMAGALDAVTFDALAVALLGHLTGPRSPRLSSESPARQVQIRERVAELRSSMRRRRSYVELLEAVWKLFQPTWEGPTGRRATRSVDRYRTMLADGRSWRSLSPTPKREQLLDRTFALAGYDLPVILSPTTALGTLFVLDVDQALVVGLPVIQPTGEDQATELARQFKAIGHPTRLAIVHQLAQRPATVSELARTFDLAQPNMTNHLRQLRDAGLVHHASGAGRALTVDPVVARELARSFLELANVDGTAATQRP